MNNKSEYQAIEELLDELNFDRKLKGYPGIRCAVSLALQDENCMFNITEMIYRAVAADQNTTWKNAEKNMRTLIEKFWKTDGKSRMKSVFHFDYEKKPTPGQMIDMISDYINKHRKQ